MNIWPGLDVIGDPLEHRSPKLDWLTTQGKNAHPAMDFA